MESWQKQNSILNLIKFSLIIGYICHDYILSITIFFFFIVYLYWTPYFLHWINTLDTKIEKLILDETHDTKCYCFPPYYLTRQSELSVHIKFVGNKAQKSLQKATRRLGQKLEKHKKGWWHGKKRRLALVYQDKPMLATSLKGRLALVYPNTLMLAPHFPHSPINTLIFRKKIYIKFYEEKIEKKE